MGSNPAAPTDFSLKNNKLGIQSVTVVSSSLNFGAKFGAKNIAISLSGRCASRRLAMPCETVFVRHKI